MSGAAKRYGMPDVGDVVADKYRIDTVLGQGGMGIVYAATNRVTQRRVALKMLLPHVADHADVGARFVREAQASGHIAHKNVVDIFDVGTSDGSLFLVMEFLTGMSLAEYLDQHGKLELTETMAILTHVCRGVAAAHEKGVIHRDLKPDNIFLRVDDKGAPLDLKVLDFGISKMDTGLSNQTGTGQSLGTPFFMPPEQMTGARSVTQAADVYALGVVIFHCLTRSYPYEAESMAVLAIKQHTEEPRSILELRPELGVEFDAVLRTALARKPHERFASVDALVSAFAPFGLGASDAALPSFTAPDRLAHVKHVSADVGSLATEVYADAEPRIESGVREAKGVAPTPAPVSEPAPSKSSWIATGVAIAVIAAIGVVGYSSSRTPVGNAPPPRPTTAIASPPPPTEAPTPAPTPAAPTTVTLHLTSDPVGAEVHLLVVPEGSTVAASGEPLALGITPIDVDFPASRVPANAELHFRVSKTGYQPLDVTRFASGARIEASFTLARRAGGAAPSAGGVSTSMTTCVGPLCGFR